MAVGANNDKLVYGGDLMLFVGTGTTKNPLAFSQSAKLSVSMKTREISSKDSGQWTEKASGKYDWNCSTDGLLSFDVTGATSSIDMVYELFLAGEDVSIVFASKTGTTPLWTVDSTKKSFTGTALITSLDINSGDGDNATYSISLEGTGQLTLS